MAAFHYQNYHIHYRQQGNETAPIALILPGNTASSAYHSGELDFFESLGYRAVAPDLLGTGQSDRLPRPWPVDWFEQNAAACSALIDHLAAGHEPSALVCGTSGGAIVALWMAILFPAQVQAVIADSEAVRFSAEMFRALAAGRSQRTPQQAAFWSGAHGDDWQSVVDADTELFSSIEKSRAAGGAWEIHQGRLPEIHCPVLFTCSLTDDLIPFAGAQMIEMASLVPGSQFYAVNQGSHPLMWSCPHHFQSAVRAFVQTIKKR